MRIWPQKAAIGVLALAVGGFGAPVFKAQAETAPAITAIEQAPDPSAAVQAYAQGLAMYQNDPAFYTAYVERVAQMGLPELGYDQARTLVKLQPNNGSAWGVIAYVEARQGNMIAAITDVRRAAQFAPNDNFVDQTAGEILAWYDVQAGKSQLPDSAKASVAKVRALMQGRAAFTDAYNAASQAYQTQAGGVQPGAYGEAVPPGGYAEVTPYSTYYYPPSEGPYYYPPDSYSPELLGPAPEPWWTPLGAWYGLSFFPEFPLFGFHHHEFFEHDHEFFERRHFHHGEGFEHGEHFEYHHEFAEHGLPFEKGAFARRHQFLGPGRAFELRGGIEPHELFAGQGQAFEHPGMFPHRQFLGHTRAFLPPSPSARLAPQAPRLPAAPTVPRALVAPHTRGPLPAAPARIAPQTGFPGRR